MMKSAWLLAAAFSLLLGSCGSVLGIFTGAPRWTVNTPRATLTTVYFTAKGTAADIPDARTAALNDLADQISEYLGLRIDESYRRELLETQGIEEFSAVVTEEYLDIGEQTATVHLLVEANRRTITDIRRVWQQKAAQEGQEYLVLRDAARRAYARNQDTDALIQYVEAAKAVSASRTAGHINLAKEYLNQAIMIMGNLRIEAQPRSSGDRRFSVRVVREGRTFSAAVSGAPVRVVYPVFNTAGAQVSREQVFKTYSRGFSLFELSHPGFRGIGLVTVHLDILRNVDIPEEMHQHPELGAKIRQLLRLETEKQAGFPFQVRTAIVQGTVLASVLEYDRGGNLRPDDAASRAVQEVFARDGITVRTISSVESEEEVRQILREQAGRDIQTGIIGSAEVITLIQSGTRHIATVRGTVQVVDPVTLRVRLSTDAVAANGIGESPEAARQAAFKRFGELAASVVLNNP